MKHNKNIYHNHSEDTMENIKISDALTLIDINTPEIYKNIGKSSLSKKEISNLMSDLKSAREGIEENRFEGEPDYLNYYYADEVKSKINNFYDKMSVRGLNKRKKYIYGRKRAVSFFRAVYHDNRILRSKERYLKEEIISRLRYLSCPFFLHTCSFLILYGSMKFNSLVYSSRMEMYMNFRNPYILRNLTCSDRYRCKYPALDDMMESAAHYASVQHHRKVGIYNKTRAGAKNFNREKDWNNRRYLSSARDVYSDIKDEYFETIPCNLIKQIKAVVR